MIISISQWSEVKSCNVPVILLMTMFDYRCNVEEVGDNGPYNYSVIN